MRRSVEVVGDVVVVDANVGVSKRVAISIARSLSGAHSGSRDVLCC